VRRYNWHSARFVGWQFPMLKYSYVFQIKCTEAILSNSSFVKQHSELFWFEITKIRIVVCVSFIIIFGTLSFPVDGSYAYVVELGPVGSEYKHFPCNLVWSVYYFL